MADTHNFSDTPRDGPIESYSQAYLATLAEKLIQGTTTPEEEMILENWYQRQPPSSQTFLWETLHHVRRGKAKKRYKEQLLKSIQASAGMEVPETEPGTQFERSSKVGITGRLKHYTLKNSTLVRSLIATAAMVLFILGWSLLTGPSLRSPSVIGTAQFQPVVPGSNGAILTLSDGRKINLDSTVEGQIASDAHSRLIKKGSVLNYELPKGPSDNQVFYNTMTTPKGRQFQLVLPDGTKVWLNAASSIHYPTAFTGKTREVRVTGEAYFEVTHRVNQPFIVQTGKTKIEVLGTRFDVMAYEDEKQQITTLLEGKVLLRNSNNQQLFRYLDPGQQAFIKPDGQFEVATADTTQVMAWVMGKLSMKNLDVATLMRQIARWYNIDVQYAGDIPQGRFGGVLNRSAQLNSVLAVMEFSGIHTKLVGRTLIVGP